VTEAPGGSGASSAGASGAGATGGSGSGAGAAGSASGGRAGLGGGGGDARAGGGALGLAGDNSGAGAGGTAPSGGSGGSTLNTSCDDAARFDARVRLEGDVWRAEHGTTSVYEGANMMDAMTAALKCASRRERSFRRAPASRCKISHCAARASATRRANRPGRESHQPYRERQVGCHC
jgi:hypothetical protein